MWAFDALQHRIADGIMAFPATPFHADLSFDERGYEAHVAFLTRHAPTALVAAGGAGELFSLSLAEHERIISATVRAADGVPVIGGIGYGTRIACEMAQTVERAGGDAVLVLPPYLVRSEQEGLFRHLRAICESTSLAVIPYSRDNAIIDPLTMIRLAGACPNIIALKDGTGDIPGVEKIRKRIGGRLAIINGAPTAEVFQQQFQEVGVSSYSSAVFTFLPLIARSYFAALRDGDRALVNTMLDEFYTPIVALRDRKRGYSVSIVKAGLRVVGASAGPVRPPLVDFDAEEEAMLSAIVEKTAQWSR